MYILSGNHISIENKILSNTFMLVIQVFIQMFLPGFTCFVLKGVLIQEFYELMSDLKKKKMGGGV